MTSCHWLKPLNWTEFLWAKLSVPKSGLCRQAKIAAVNKWLRTSRDMGFVSKTFHIFRILAGSLLYIKILNRLHFGKGGRGWCCKNILFGKIKTIDSLLLLTQYENCFCPAASLGQVQIKSLSPFSPILSSGLYRLERFTNSSLKERRLLLLKLANTFLYSCHKCVHRVSLFCLLYICQQVCVLKRIKTAVKNIH